MDGTLLGVAAYTAAVDGDRTEAGVLITAAHVAAARLGRDVNPAGCRPVMRITGIDRLVSVHASRATSVDAALASGGEPR
jgi:hypothetical protein